LACQPTTCWSTTCYGGTTLACRNNQIPTHPPIDQIRVLHGVVVVQNQEGIFQMRGTSR
jgi:hypothetical protein